MKIGKETTYHLGLFLLDWRKLTKTRAFFLSNRWLSSLNFGWKLNKDIYLCGNSFKTNQVLTFWSFYLVSLSQCSDWIYTQPTNFKLVQSLRMCGSLLPLPFVVCLDTGTTLLIMNTKYLKCTGSVLRTVGFDCNTTFQQFKVTDFHVHNMTNWTHHMTPSRTCLQNSSFVHAEQRNDTPWYMGRFSNIVYALQML
jgi:hypothetical protein